MKRLLFCFLVSLHSFAEEVVPVVGLESLNQAPVLRDKDGKTADGRYTKSADREVSRSYTKSGIVRINRASGAVEERPYIALPILFIKGEATLLPDGTSEQNLLKTAEKLRQLIQDENARFEIEGHASVDGPVKVNEDLAERRARAILDQLTGQRHGVQASHLIARGYGIRFARAKESDGEEALQQDRVVRVVRIR